MAGAALGLAALLLTPAARGAEDKTPNACTNFRLGDDLTINDATGIRGARLSEDGESLLVASADGTIKRVDLGTGKETTIRSIPFLNRCVFSPNGKKIVTSSCAILGIFECETIVIDLETNAEIPTGLPGPWKSMRFSPDSTKLVATAYADGRARIFDLDTRIGKEIHHGETINSAEFSPDGKRLLTTSNNNTIQITELESGEKTLLNNNSFYYPKEASFFPDGQKVAVGLLDGSVNTIDLQTKKETPLDVGAAKATGFITFLEPSADGRDIAVSSYNGDTRVVDTKFNKVTPLKLSKDAKPLQLSSDGKKFLSMIDKTVFLSSTVSICVSDPYRIAEPQNTACKTGDANPIPESVSNVIKAVTQDAHCTQDFNPELWKSITPAPPKNPIQPEMAKDFLRRFQKPGGFEPIADLPIMLAILRSQIPKSDPELVNLALQGVLYTSKSLYQGLLDKFPALVHAPLAAHPQPGLSCRTPAEVEKILARTKAYVSNLLVKNGPNSTYEQWNSLRPLTSLLSQFKPEEKDAFSESIADQLSDGAAVSPNLSGVFHSKLYKFSHEAVLPLFGEKQKPLTDLTLIRKENSIQPILLGMSPIDQDEAGTINAYGFYAKLLTPIPVSSEVASHEVTSEKQFNWSQNSKNYHAQLKLTTGGRGDIIPGDSAPRYPELWKDGKLTGLVISGSNLGIGKDVIDEYLEYYSDRGFEFEAEKPIPDMKKFLSKKIASGEVDYFVKEAHSDGDEKNVFRMDASAKVLVGHKRSKPGKPLRDEVVYLIYPDASKKASVLLANEEFGEWIRAREKAGKGQFVYFNTSCWSKTKALHEIQAAATPTLLDIPTMSVTQTFTNTHDDAEQLLLSSFREGKNYSKMREALMRNRHYKDKKKNVFSFPDEASYKTEITNLVKIPLRTELKITDNEGKPFNIDEVE